MSKDTVMIELDEAAKEAKAITLPLLADARYRPLENEISVNQAYADFSLISQDNINQKAAAEQLNQLVADLKRQSSWGLSIKLSVSLLGKTQNLTKAKVIGAILSASITASSANKNTSPLYTAALTRCYTELLSISKNFNLKLTPDENKPAFQAQEDTILILKEYDQRFKAKDRNNLLKTLLSDMEKKNFPETAIVERLNREIATILKHDLAKPGRDISSSRYLKTLTAAKDHIIENSSEAKKKEIFNLELTALKETIIPLIQEKIPTLPSEIKNELKAAFDKLSIAPDSHQIKQAILELHEKIHIKRHEMVKVLDKNSLHLLDMTEKRLKDYAAFNRLEKNLSQYTRSNLTLFSKISKKPPNDPIFYASLPLGKRK